MHDAGDKARILVVDQDAVERLAAGDVLRAAGYAVSEAATADQAMTRFEAEHPALVLLEAIHPGMGGCDLCQEIRRHPAGTEVPIIVMAGLDDKASIDAAYALGATDFVTKPILWDLLAHRVAYALRASRILHGLRASEALVATAQRLAHLGSWVWRPSGQKMERSAEYYRIFDATPEEFGDSPYAAMDRVDAADRTKVQSALTAALSEGRPYGMDFRIHRRDGVKRRLYEQVEVVRDADEEVEQVQGVTQDITERVEAEARIRLLAYYDNLTGLANRTLFREMMAHALQQADRMDAHCAVLFVDLDRFKRINESLGHEAGDTILRVTAERLVSCLRSADLKGVNRSPLPEQAVARLGGDEFTLLLFDVSAPAFMTQVARRMMEAVQRPIPLGGKEVTVSASIGIAMFPQDGTEPELLLKHAETAMFAAKEGGREGVRFYNRAMSLAVQSKLAIESDMRLALQRHEFCLHYQAQVNSAKGVIVGAEALIRWQHPERGLVAPGEFIPVAEESGLIIPITDWVVRETCRQIRQWRELGLTVVPVSINLSGVSFRQHGLTETLLDALRDNGVDPSLLQCEVTESVLMQDLDRSVLTLNVIKEMGVSLAVDDFGTGYSSLTYLKRFPVDALKIDRSFVSEVTRGADDAAIAGAIIAMGRNLRLAVIAEGVETADQARFLIERGCTLSQGFLYARPVPAAEFERLLREGIKLPPELLAPAAGE